MGHDARKHVLLHANYKGADQPVHPRSLIITFANRLLESKIFKLANAKFQYYS